MKVFAISGLGADERVFQYLSLKVKLTHVTWLSPAHKEPIAAYAQRLVDTYQIGEKDKDFGLLGVSFGGLVAIEISKLVKPRFTAIISSVETQGEISTLLRFIGKIRIIDALPLRFFRMPKALTHYLFGTAEKELLNAILNESDPRFTQWALRELMNWKNQTRPNPLIKIGGTKDKLLPPKGSNTILVQQGEHFMIVDKAQEVSDLINVQLRAFV